MTTAITPTTYIVLVLFLFAVVAFTVPQRTYWSYECCNIGGYDALVFYEPSVAFVFYDRKTFSSVSNTGVFPVAGWGTQYNVLSFTTIIDGNRSSKLKFFYSHVNSKAYWKIDDTEITISKKGKKMTVNDQSVNWRNDVMTIVHVGFDARFRHAISYIPKVSLFEEKLIMLQPDGNDVQSGDELL